MCVCYPKSAKAYLRLVYAEGVTPTGAPPKLQSTCRKAALKDVELLPFQCEALLAMGRTQRRLSVGLGITEIAPTIVVPPQK